ncbi:nucleotidyltransferase domain-containing protein [Marinitenerispora sediminis]|uniref:Amino acid transporter n=1 Tax=Marinitenerispora sediminis TaxID=1931232 RepID=A0A368T9F3_9ACTN|nr:amino acid transporter [Marinitenerispora sediminis]RCV54591.1 amino acid transporter [Marinitenerispora sediminis]RCV59854.1 amino acid transporter [Marinitenerispora sediminis]RCV61181.1 amino acid transporter [Marinitenerispora sediminis]
MRRTDTAWGPWEPAVPSDVAALFSAARVPWWIAGGHAIALAVGHVFREHGDIDVLLLRRDQLAVQRLLPTWEWWAADPPGTLRPWAAGETLPAGVHDVWCRPGPAQPWRIQILLDEADGREWVSRRDPRVRRPLDRLGAVSPEGVPYLRPEVQLFYKAQRPRPKDEQDLAAALPVLGSGQRRWLAGAISLAYGDHPWTGRLHQRGRT